MESVDQKIINDLFKILTELDAREGGNCVASELLHKSWYELCNDAIDLLEILKK